MSKRPRKSTRAPESQLSLLGQYGIQPADDEELGSCTEAEHSSTPVQGERVPPHMASLSTHVATHSPANCCGPERSFAPFNCCLVTTAPSAPNSTCTSPQMISTMRWPDLTGCLADSTKHRSTRARLASRVQKQGGRLSE